MLRLAESLQRTGQCTARSVFPRSVANAADQASTREDQDLKDANARLVQSIIRVNLVGETAAAALFSGRCRVLHHPPDVKAFLEAEQAQLQRVQALAPEHRTRPSLLGPLVSAAFTALGAATALAPRGVSAAVTAGVQDALTDTYTGQLRELRECGIAEAVPDLRQVVRGLRDGERAPEGAPHVPDVSVLWSRPSAEEGVAAVVKAATRALLTLAKRV